MHQYNFNINILNYFRLRSLLQVFISKFSYGDNFKFQRPFILFHVKYLIRIQGNKEIYNHMTIIEKNQPRRCETQLRLKLNASLNTRLWPVIYKICNKIIQDNTIVWF